MITWAQQYVSAANTVVLALDHADLCRRHHLGCDAARAGHAPEARRRHPWPSAALVIDHPCALRPTPQAFAAVTMMGIFSSAIGLMLFYMCLTRLGTLTTNAQGYLRIPIGVRLSVVLLGETVPSNLVLGILLVMSGVAAMTIPGNWRSR
jgi:hypothetical protein